MKYITFEHLSIIIREIKGMTTRQIPTNKINQKNPKAVR